MKLLLCINRSDDFKELFSKISQQSGLSISMPDTSSSHYTTSLHFLGHEIEICELGFGVFQTCYKLTKVLSQKKYHLAIKASFCNAYKPDIQIGEVVSVIKEKPGDIGITAEEGFMDLYDLKLLNAESFPHYKGALINMNNSYMNVMMPYRKVVSVTVNLYADRATYVLKKEKYKADTETGDGLGFVYPCMSERQPFYQLNVVERNLASGDYDFEKAKQKLNETLFDILQKI